MKTTGGLICDTSGELLMRIDYLSTILKANMDIVVLTVLASAIVIFGGIAVYLAGYHHEGANITKVGDALWWAVVTVATVGYGDTEELPDFS